MKVYNEILNAESQSEAIDYARGIVWGEVELSEQHIKYSRYIDTVNGVDVYYDYGADYYFFVDNSDE